MHVRLYFFELVFSKTFYMCRYVTNAKSMQRHQKKSVILSFYFQKFVLLLADSEWRCGECDPKKSSSRLAMENVKYAFRKSILLICQMLY